MVTSSSVLSSSLEDTAVVLKDVAIQDFSFGSLLLPFPAQKTLLHLLLPRKGLQQQENSQNRNAVKKKKKVYFMELSVNRKW